MLHVCCILFLASSLSVGLATSDQNNASMSWLTPANARLMSKKAEPYVWQENDQSSLLQRKMSHSTAPADEELHQDKCIVSSLMNYIEKRGGSPTAEGGTDNAEFIEEEKLITEVTAKTVCETGFNAGASALAWLCSSPDTTVHSFDIGEHAYVPIAKDYLLEHFGEHRLTLTLGDSTSTLPAAYQAKNISCDVAFIDGGHTFEVALADIKNLRSLTATGGRMLLENCNSHGEENGFGGMGEVNKAYQAALNQGIIQHEKQISTAGCQSQNLDNCREICVARYL